MSQVQNPPLGDDLLRAALALAVIWSLLGIAAALASRFDPSPVTLIAFAGATALLIATRRPGPRRGAASSGLAFTLGALAGFASFPAWIAGIGAAGLALGLAARAPASPGAGDPALWAACLLLAPVFEELLYRERLLGALRPAIGAGPAIAATSVLFAIPHLDPWRMLATLGVGLVLGAARIASGSLALCIGLHGGLNLAAWACGVPPVERALAPGAAALAGCAALAAGVLLSRTGDPRRPRLALEVGPS